jgi:hypothetical protein
VTQDDDVIRRYMASLARRKAQLVREGKLPPSAAGGAPRSRKQRCACGANTLKRARSRAFECCRKAGVQVKVEL